MFNDRTEKKEKGKGQVCMEECINMKETIGFLSSIKIIKGNSERTTRKNIYK